MLTYECNTSYGPVHRDQAPESVWRTNRQTLGIATLSTISAFSAKWPLIHLAVPHISAGSGPKQLSISARRRMEGIAFLSSVPITAEESKKRLSCLQRW
jgi:hypothetical protein